MLHGIGMEFNLFKGDIMELKVGQWIEYQGSFGMIVEVLEDTKQYKISSMKPLMRDFTTTISEDEVTKLLPYEN